MRFITMGHRSTGLAKDFAHNAHNLKQTIVSKSEPTFTVQRKKKTGDARIDRVNQDLDDATNEAAKLIQREINSGPGLDETERKAKELEAQVNQFKQTPKKEKENTGCCCSCFGWFGSKKKKDSYPSAVLPTYGSTSTFKPGKHR